MIDDKPVPTLSSDGWVTNTVMKADYLLSHFFLSEYSRTYLYLGDISSFPWILQKYKDDIYGLEDNTRQTLKKYFGRYFPKAEVDVKIKKEEGSKYAIIVVVIVTDVGGREFSVGRLADVLDAKILKVQKINNTGVTS